MKKIRWGRPTGIHVRSDGTIEQRLRPLSLLQPGGSIDLLSIPPKATDLHFSSLHLSGTLNTAGLPRTLRRLSCVENELRGGLNTLALPKFCISVEVGSNRLEGSVCLETLPETLIILRAAKDAFSGEIDICALPPVLNWLDLSNNSLQGTISLECIPESINGNNLRQKVLYVERVGERFQGLSITEQSCDFVQNNSGIKIVCRRSTTEPNVARLEVRRSGLLRDRSRLSGSILSLDELTENVE